MKIGFLQFDVCKNIKENIDKIKEILNQVQANIFVLPELSTCGYLFDNKESLFAVSEVVPYGQICEEMMKLSKLHKCALIFGMAELENNNIYNTAVIVENGKYVGKYRKIHLSNYEKKFFEKGNTNNTFSVQGIKIGVQICFDLWFPEISREQILQGANLLCVLSNFGGETTYDISRIRAIENITPVILSNRVGIEQVAGVRAEFLGKSTIINHEGKRLIVGEKDIETYATYNIEPNQKSNVICDNFMEEICFHHPL